MNSQLKQIYQADISDRNRRIPDTQLIKNDRKRLDLVKKILKSDVNLEAQDYHHAALIYQHGKTLEDFQKAHESAMKAVELGDQSARWLAAASLDRILIMDGKPQKYGTQFILNDSGEWELSKPIDPTMTDKERAKWNVPPLKDAMKIFKTTLLGHDTSNE